MLRTVQRTAAMIDRLNSFVGRSMTMAMFLIVLIGASVAVLRYVFRVGYPWLSESFVWLNGAAFMLASAWVLVMDKHVRVDAVYTHMSARWKAASNIFGTVFFLWPTVSVIAWYGYPSVLRSWKASESSPTIDGLPVLYLLKTTILCFCVLLALQGLSLVLKSAADLAAGPHKLKNGPIPKE